MKTEDYKDLCDGNNIFPIEVAIERLTVLKYIIENPSDELIIAILEWGGETDLSTACNPYWDMVWDLWRSVSAHDFNSSQTAHNAQFLAEMILWLDAENKERAAQRKRDKIARLKKELDELETSELSTELGKGE